MERWPNFFIVGAPKAGTTSMYFYLNQIPQVFMSPVKEPNFFATDHHRFKSFPAVKSKERYLQLFKNSKDKKIVGEASPSYLHDPDAVNLISKQNPDSKILIMLRNPVTRTFSNYLHLKQYHNEELSLKEIISNWRKDPNLKDEQFRRKECISLSFYYEPVKKYLEKFEDVLVIYFEDFVKDANITMESIFKFLDIEYNLSQLQTEAHNSYFEPKGKIARMIITNPTVKKIANKFVSQSLQTTILEKALTKKAEKPKISEKDKYTLKDIFAKDVEKLRTLLHNNPPPW